MGLQNKHAFIDRDLWPIFQEKKFHCSGKYLVPFTMIADKAGISHAEVTESYYRWLDMKTTFVTEPIKNIPKTVNGSRIKTLVALPDLHVPQPCPGEIHGSALAALEFCNDFKPDEIVGVGDWGEFESISHWMKNKKLDIEGLRLSRDLDAVNTLVDDCCRMTDKFTYIKGNHEEWLDKYINEHPELLGMFELHKYCEFEKKNIEWFEYGKVYTVGNVNLTHGWYANKYHANKHATEYGDNIYYGHTHDVQSFTHHRRSHEDQLPFEAMSIGCLCETSPAYVKNRPHKRVNAFGIFYIMDDGSYTRYVPIIINDQFIWNGKLYKG